MNDRVMNAVTIVLASCALIATGLLVRRELFAPNPVRDVAEATKPSTRTVPDWRTYTTAGQHIGSRDAKLQIVVFSDFECPFCGKFAREIMPGILAQHPRDVAFLFRHLPLPNHRFAIPAARAAECAGRQGKFAEYHDALFQRQDSLGLIPFEVLAARVAIPSESKFRHCVSGSEHFPEIDADVAAATRLAIAATPSLLINDKLFKGVPSSRQLDSMIRQALSSR